MVVCKLSDKQVESFKFMATPIIHRLLLKVCLLLSPFFSVLPEHKEFNVTFFFISYILYISKY